MYFVIGSMIVMTEMIRNLLDYFTESLSSRPGSSHTKICTKLLHLLRSNS